jgi:hypothetical protein
MKNVSMLSLTPRTIHSQLPVTTITPTSAEINLNFDSSPSTLTSILVDSNTTNTTKTTKTTKTTNNIQTNIPNPENNLPIITKPVLSNSQSKWFPSIIVSANTKEAEDIIDKIYQNRKHVMRMASCSSYSMFPTPSNTSREIDTLNTLNAINVSNTNPTSQKEKIKQIEPKSNRHRKMKFAKSYPSSNNFDYYDDHSSSTDELYDQNLLSKKLYSHRKRKKHRKQSWSEDTSDSNNIEQSIEINKQNQLWNDEMEEYHKQFQKICKQEANDYKNLYYRHSTVSNLLKVILLLTNCFTFTLSISGVSLDFLQITTIISTALTTTITSLSGFFAYEKQSEIEYNIYKELDCIANLITLELIKPNTNRKDPFEFIISLQNRRNELFQSLHDKK